MYVIFINCKLFPFISWIISGLKTYETRNRNTLKKFIGKTVYLAETGKGKAPIIRCHCTITDYIVITDKATYNIYRKQTKVKRNSIYDFTSTTKQKVLYRLENVKACVPFELPKNATRYGRIYAKINNQV